MAAMSTRLFHQLVVFLLLTQLIDSVLVPKMKNHPQHKLHEASSTYIVHCNHHAKPPHFADLEQWYHSMVAAHSPRAGAATNTTGGRILYTYDTVMHGFAVQLTGDEARRMSSAAGVTGVHEDRALHFLTTRSPGFLGLDPGFGAWKDTDFGDGIIIGIIDTGIWPESPSFNDSGLGPVRSSWKGGCVDAWNFNASLCNNKIIGAKAFGATSRGSPRDTSGHGTHVSSTAVGSEVHDVGFLTFAKGTARGVAPKARIAMYATPNPVMSYVAMAIDAAVKDGVDIISMSMADDEPHPFYNDTFSIATFGAERKGVFVVLAGGNEGPNASTVKNLAPWMTTVGASTVDRLFPASLHLGNGAVLNGQSFYTVNASASTMVPIVFSSCSMGDVTPGQITGKIVVCKGEVQYPDILMDSLVRYHAAGLVFQYSPSWYRDSIDDSIMFFPLPGLVLSYTEARELDAYMASGSYPVASLKFSCQTVIGENRAPMVPSFSSRGPNPIVPELIKPDVIAPGVSIIAAMTPMGEKKDNNYDMDSGTSMATPHVAGVAALIRKKYPSWTPAMIRSAIMTTADTLDNMKRDILDNTVVNGSRGAMAATPFAAGAGHVRPQLAMDPGLVYDAGERDYINFLCSLNYTAQQMLVFVPDFVNCTGRTLSGGPAGLNYPSFVVVFDNGNDVRTLTRTVTKVSRKAETYNVTIAAPDRVKVTVMPTTLEFKNRNEKKSYTVEFRNLAGRNVTAGWDFGHISWENKDHLVRSPVAFHWKN